MSNNPDIAKLLKDADAPFNDPNADIIIRSCDDVDFHAHKTILSLASPVFADMFVVCQPPISVADQDVRDHVHVVKVTEDSRTLDLILRWCYPVVSPVMEELEDIRVFLEVSRKYGIETLDEHIKQALMAAIEHDPWGAYAVASSYGISEVDTKAATSSLKTPLIDLTAVHPRFPTLPVLEKDLIRHYELCRRGVPSHCLSKFDALLESTVEGYACLLFKASSDATIPLGATSNLGTIKDSGAPPTIAIWPSRLCNVTDGIQLIMYQLRCSRAAHAMMSDLSWLVFYAMGGRFEGFFLTDPPCWTCWNKLPFFTFLNTTRYAPKAFLSYLCRVRDVLVARPCREALDSVEGMGYQVCNGCACSRDWSKFESMVVETIALELGRVIAKVPMPPCK